MLFIVISKLVQPICQEAIKVKPKQLAFIFLIFWNITIIFLSQERRIIRVSSKSTNFSWNIINGKFVQPFHRDHYLVIDGIVSF